MMHGEPEHRARATLNTSYVCSSLLFPTRGQGPNVPLCPPQHPTELEIQILQGSLKLLATTTRVAEPGQDLPQPQAEREYLPLKRRRKASCRCGPRGVQGTGCPAEELDLEGLRWTVSTLQSAFLHIWDTPGHPKALQGSSVLLLGQVSIFSPSSLVLVSGLEVKCQSQ